MEINTDGIFQSSDGNIEAIWGNFYTLIARSNYYIDSYQKLVNGEIPGISEADRALIDCWAGEAYFSRAFAYYNLANVLLRGIRSQHSR